ncbi:putative Pantothenate kinase 4 [Operophtera brumata]|uniref:Putative Pantothenate kinase 4 n=1 Tax=Operophtera brumata TaxID=104452 RepID=A0A0L7LKC7_OPEBR|nr:putative Pantothenate kinase 4 [Operophtera brumata]
MSSAKALLCDLCVILVVGSALTAEDIPVSLEEPKGNCTCGGFPSNTAKPGVVPMISQSPGLAVKCDEDGDNTCKQLCIALATTAKAKGPDVLCNRLQDVEELKLSAFYKVCDRPWAYADMTADEPLCCKDNKTTVCASAANATRPADLDTSE